MECQIRSMASSSIADEVNIPEGKVEAVCREWLVREDGVLAYKLQTEEIQHHYGHNKERNQLVRSDLQEARTAQKTEEEEAAMVKMAYEKMLKEQEDHDAFIAHQLQEKILKEEMDRQKQIELEDQRIALELQRKEKLRLQRKREEKEMRQAEKARAELSGASNSSSVKSIDDLVATKEACTSPLERSISNLTLEPPENLSPEELQKFIEHRDAELARLLQEQELKHQGETKQDRQIAIEAQDRELAKVLQEQERAKARKARERAKQKAALAQQQEHGGTTSEAQPHILQSTEHDTIVKERLRSPDWSTADRRSFASDFSGDPVDNIAAAIDPTFNANSSNMGSPVSRNSSIGSSTSRISSLKSPFASPSTEVPPYCAAIDDGFFMNGEDGSAVPPYMPVQGTRRPTSLEKGKKSKKGKDGCKTQ
ncbi:coiled-coil domain-containing protein 50-like [Stegodyphus dumicola]|uniref:coiled-coil domain-containing protein 50-like n=1 Tax=Stegodyphus dumicola TaxID=202533 RepID=UPI0015B35D64|nr:coiled-coil domain-containing protein 50-like [Stegodyphus dumicola]